MTFTSLDYLLFPLFKKKQTLKCVSFQRKWNIIAFPQSGTQRKSGRPSFLSKAGCASLMWVSFKEPVISSENVCVCLTGEGRLGPQKEITFKPGVFLLCWEHIYLISRSFWGSCGWNPSGIEPQLWPAPPACPPALKLTMHFGPQGPPVPASLRPLSSEPLWPLWIVVIHTERSLHRAHVDHAMVPILRGDSET